MTQTILNEFITTVKTSQTLWALQDKKSEDWVVLDSIHFENTDVMPVWSSEELAKHHCIDEWKDYTPCAITVADWLEFWVEDLLEDGVIVGVNWPVSLNDNSEHHDRWLEVELSEFTQALASIEKL